jgi:hypothetical protein
MTITTEYLTRITIMCDHAGCYLSERFTATSRAAAIEAAQGMGWYTLDDHTLCPLHDCVRIAKERSNNFGSA